MIFTFDHPKQNTEFARWLDGVTTLAYDTEFIRESTYAPELQLIQIARPDGEIAIVDVATLQKLDPSGSGLAPLLSVMKDTRVLKIVHAAQADQECMYTAFGIIPSPVVDTAQCAALAGAGESAGLGTLTRQFLGVELKKGHARSHWGKRPLPEALIEYAAQDVQYLIPLVETLREKLEASDRWNWALSLGQSWSQVDRFLVTPAQIFARLYKSGKFRTDAAGVLLELIEWREGVAKQLNRPRRWIADDSILADLAQVQPAELADLAHFRALTKKEIDRWGQEMIAAVQKGKSRVVTAELDQQRDGRPDDRESVALQFLQLGLSHLADEARVAPSLIIGASGLLRAMRARPANVEALISLDVLQPEAVPYFAESLLGLFTGRLALRFKDKKVRIYELR